MVLTFFLSFFLSFDHKIVWLKRYTINHDMFVPIERKEKDQPPSTKLTFSFLFFFFLLQSMVHPTFAFFFIDTQFISSSRPSFSLSLSSSQAFQTVCVYVVYSQHDHFYDTYIYIYIDCTFTIRTRSSTLKCIYDQRWFDNVSLFIFIFTHTFSSSTLDLIHI